MPILTGTVAGAVVFLMCIYFYKRGVRQGMKEKEKSIDHFKSQGTETENELMKKYMALLNYDPYGDNREAFSEREGNRT